MYNPMMVVTKSDGYYTVMCRTKIYLIKRVNENHLILYFDLKEIKLTSFINAFLALDILLTDRSKKNVYLN